MIYLKKVKFNNVKFINKNGQLIMIVIYILYNYFKLDKAKK